MRSETGEVSVRALAVRHETHRRTVRLALESAVPPQKRSPGSRPAPTLGAFHDADRRVAARRIARRRASSGTRRGGSSSGCVMSMAVRPPRRRCAITCARAGARSAWAARASCRRPTRRRVDAQVDWGEADVELGGAAHAGVLVRDARVLVGRGVLGGVPVAVADGVPGGPRARVRVVRWRLRDDPLRQSERRRQAGAAWASARADRPLRRAARRTTCSSRSSPRRGSQGAHEKGGIEGEVGRFRRRHLVPVPPCAAWASSTRRSRRASSTTSAGASTGGRTRSGRCSGRSVAGSRGCRSSAYTAGRARDACASTQRAW